MLKPLRGDIWSIDLDSTKGYEQSGKRTGLVLSENTFNLGPAGLVVVLPITSKFIHEIERIAAS
ncbi:MAG: type II toxin-antitoxin system PemK/MazF family toxin [Thermodesulfobacteriota bacterium]